MPPEQLERYRYVIYLLNSYHAGKLTIQEKKDLDKWLNASLENKQLFKEFMNSEKQQEAVSFMNSVKTAKALKVIKQQIKERRIRTRKKLVASLLAASVFIGALILFTDLIKNTKTDINYNQNHLSQVDSVLNQDKVVLIMQSGEAIAIEENLLTKIDNPNILYEKGRVTYLPSSAEMEEESRELSLNTIITPKGGKYEVVLPDGTLVYINTASRLTYPVDFVGDTRRVELEGEAYFEVSHHENKPFIVETNKQSVKVLGTHFNVKAYKEDSFYQTSLLEGQVEVSSNGSNSSVVLQPGEEVVLNIKSGVVDKRSVPIKKMALWKKSMFYFNNEPIEEVMKVISRWYNVEIEYANEVTNELFTGEISRYLALNDVLKTLELTGKVTFKINENGKVKVSK